MVGDGDAMGIAAEIAEHRVLSASLRSRSDWVNLWELYRGGAWA